MARDAERENMRTDDDGIKCGRRGADKARVYDSTPTLRRAQGEILCRCRLLLRAFVGHERRLSHRCGMWQYDGEGRYENLRASGVLILGS